jgi:hypothetical protein
MTRHHRRRYLEDHRVPGVFFGLGIPVLAVPVRHAIPGDQKTVGFELGDVRDQPAGGRIKLIP